MTDPAWSPDVTPDTNSTRIIGEADRLERRLRKPVHQVPVLARLDDSMRNRIDEWFNTHA